jgi:N4-bis(aminopropyl)spermidine synthase
MNLDDVVTQVAAAVGLAEGESGIRDILAAVLAAEPGAVREIARLAELPVPIVAAAGNELRARGVLATQRPVQLTPAGRAAVAASVGLSLDPAALADLAAPGGPLQAAADGAPGAKTELDQTHCTVATKLARVVRMHEARALAGQRVLVLGDDDLISVAIAHVLASAGHPAAIRRLTVVDTDADVLAWIRAQVASTGVAVEAVEHDLRQPLPPHLVGVFDVVLTDPPYTVTGAELFLSRAVAGLAAQPGRHVFFSFGARRPDETIAVQRGMAAMGLAIRSLVPGFNSYVGAGVLAGTSSLYHLRTAPGAQPLLAGPYDGPLYSAANRAAATRPYRCARCKAVHHVGPGSTWPQIAALRAAGCPDCGGTVFRPMPLVAR